MVNKNLDEDKIVTVEMNKRTYHYISGLLANNTFRCDINVLSERKNSETFHNNDFKKPCPDCVGKSKYAITYIGSDKLICEKCNGQGFIK